MKDETRRLGLWALAVALTVGAYHLSVLGLLMLLPLGWLRATQGDRPFLMGAVVASVAIVLVEMVWKGIEKQAWSLVDGAVLSVPLMLIAAQVGLAWLERFRWRFLVRLLVVTAVLGVVSFNVVMVILTNEPMSQVFRKSFDLVWKSTLESLGTTVKTDGLDAQWFFETLKTLFLSSFLFVMFLTLGWTQWVTGRFFGTGNGAGGDSRSFFLPSWVSLAFLVVLLGALVGAVLGLFQTRFFGPWVGYGFWSLGMVLWAVHLRAGLGVFLTWVDRLIPVNRRWMVGLGLLVVVLIVPWIFPVVAVGLPTLAVLELWMNLRIRTQGVGK